MDINNLKPGYVNIGYSIHTPSYYSESNGLGFNNEDEAMAFHADCERIFKGGGWNIEHGYAVKGKSNLHLHPQQFLGIVHTELVDIVPELIARATLFKFQQNGKRIIGEIYDITEEQQREYLTSKRTEIEAELIKAFSTKRRNQYYVPGSLLWWDLELPIGQKYGLPAIDDQVNNAAGRYVAEVLDSLLTTGRIIRKENNGNPAYRSRMKSEMPRKRREIISSPDTPELF